MPGIAAPIRLTPVDARLVDAPPILCLVRLDGPLASAAVAEAFRRHRPRRLSTAAVLTADGPELRPDAGDAAFGTVDAGAGELDRLTGVGVPVADLAAIGLGDAAAREPVCTLTHVRAQDGDALAIRLSHAAGDGLSLLGMLGPLLEELGRPATGVVPPASPADGPPPTAARHRTGDHRVLSVLPLSAAAHDELAALAVARPALSPTVRRMAVLARRVVRLVRPGDPGLRIRIPIDLRFRDLGIPRSAVGNHWFDALAVLGARSGDLPPAEEIADAVDAAIGERLALLRPDDVDHRDDESLRLRRDLSGEPLRRGIDVVFSSLPAPAWPGVRALHVLGSSSLGVVDVRGADRVDLVTARPLPAGTTAL